VRTWWHHRLVLLTVACLAFCVLFVLLAGAVVAQEAQSVDQSIRQWMLGHQTPARLTFVRTATDVGERLLIVCAVVVAWLLFRRGEGITALVMCGMPFVSPLIVDELKAWYGIMRPSVGFGTPNASFPSGHTSAGTAVALVLGYALAREGISRRVGLGVAIISPLLVGVSRVYVDRHWASDVLGGWILGLALSAAVCLLYELMRLRKPHRLDLPPDDRRGEVYVTD
jgi:membrane-associated phospholipid phosphatase